MVERESEYRFCSRYGLHWQDKETISDISSLYGEHECIKAGRCKYTTQGLFLANAAFHKDKMSGDTDVHKKNLSGEICTNPYQKDNFFTRKPSVGNYRSVSYTSKAWVGKYTKTAEEIYQNTYNDYCMHSFFYIYKKSLMYRTCTQSSICWCPKVWYILL